MIHRKVVTIEQAKEGLRSKIAHTRSKYGLWTPETESLLREFYPEMSRKHLLSSLIVVLRQITGHTFTYAMVSKKAERMGLTQRRAKNGL